jgi:uncharacterized protein
MKTLIIGATGFIGRELVKELLENGHKPVAVSRNAAKAAAILGNETQILEWNGKSASELARLLPGFDAVINLAGENLAAGRWTESRKKLLIDSRVKTGMLLAKAIRMADASPSMLIQGSAIGIYGSNVASQADESSPIGSGFIAGLTADWEASVCDIKSIVPRIAWIRTGLVLGRNGGLLEKMLLPFRFYSGTVIGPGTQILSWIHLKDLTRGIRFILESRSSEGPYNIVAPDAVSMKDFIRLIGSIIGKPAWMRVPSWAIRAALGEMAEETVLASQSVYPARLLQEGFRFDYEKPEPALRNLLEK